VDYDASEARNVDSLFFTLGWDWYGFDKKHIRAHYTELVFLHSVEYAGHVVHSGVSGVPTSMHYFSCLGGTDMYSTKSAQDTLCRTCIFAFGGICGSRSAFRCVRGANVDALFFMIGWDRYLFDKKRVLTHYAEHVFFCIWWDLRVR
jgi:hypothetical protein